MQTNLKELLETPDQFLSEITDREFISRIEGNPPGPEPDKVAKPAENPFSPPDQQPGGLNPDGPQQTNVKASEIVSGELATDLMDKILPVVLSLAANRFLDVEVPKRNFALSAAEKSTIAPIMDKCLERLNISFENPFIALAMSLSFIYGSKFIDVANNPDFAKQVKKASGKVSQTANAAAQSEQPTTPRPAGKGLGGRALTRKPGETRGRKPKDPVKLEFR